ncbi:hypothetical protein NST99_13845 [Paenibacillus sp. FSL L8-0470]|uniref:hypothetical protein n=1 Tax=Paenibacillus sp. FSL L8-0470 TaxID=2954688 RepID=UPI0030FBD816
MKKRTRRLLLRKYAVILLLFTLSLLYLYFSDWLFGYGMGYIRYIRTTCSILPRRSWLRQSCCCVC